MATKLSSFVCPSRPLKTNLSCLPLSLKRLAAERVLKTGIHWRSIADRLPMDIIDWFDDYPLYYEWLDAPTGFNFSRSRRIEPNWTTLVVYLSHLTLIIVPDNLVAQWTGEIYKHIEDGQLDFIVYDNPKQPIQPPLELLKHDLILISQSRFSYEHQKGGLDFRSRACQCPYIGSTRERACLCDLEIKPYVSPLLQIHWKRVIADEGHRLSQRNKLSELAQKLFCHARWICTGTPTQHLTDGLHESDDLKRLGQLLIQLGLEPFSSHPRLWHKYITQPFLKRAPWALRQCDQILKRTLVRHQPADIQREVALPPLYQRIVYLEFDRYQWLAHNCQIAMISLNAILSQREGPDYLFSAKNIKSLRETVHNLWQGCLWHSVDPGLLRSALENCRERCEMIGQDQSADDRDMFRIRDLLQEADASPDFLEIMNQSSPAWIVQGFSDLRWGQLMQADEGERMMQAQRLQEENVASEKARVTGVTSSKLNYLMNQIIRFHQKEKCIVFAQHHNERVEIYLLLKRLTKIRVLIYHENKMTNAQRSNIILTFNTSENANVIIMPVRKAAYGIDLSSATRVFFVSPVWQTAVEQQAIKRAHRIGQTKPVFVETLVMKDTIEDAMLKRRAKAHTEEFFEDHTLKHILNHARFVPRHCSPVLFDEPIHFNGESVKQQEVQSVVEGADNIEEKTDDNIEGVIETQSSPIKRYSEEPADPVEEPQAKKKKGVRFSL
ncbi:hypothetical protein G6F56_007976 [Rhizopus delemar]|nr:hypothetical protein G6F56_007976 [Rhizopus delemar]